MKNTSVNHSYINKEASNKPKAAPFFNVYSDYWGYRTPDPNAANESYTPTGDVDMKGLMQTIEKRNEVRRSEKAKQIKEKVVEVAEQMKDEESENNFWFQNPGVLLRDWAELLPDSEETDYAKYLNSFVRLSILVCVIMWYFKRDSKLVWLPIVTMILTIYLFTFKIKTLDQLKSNVGEGFGSYNVEEKTFPTAKSFPKNLDPAVNKGTESESVNNSFNYSLLNDVDKTYTTFTPKLSDKPGDYQWVNAFDHEYFRRTRYSPTNQNWNFELYGDVSEKFSRFNAERNKEKLVPFERSLDNWPAMVFGKKCVDRKLYYNDR